VVELQQYCLGPGTGSGVPIQIDDVRSPLGYCAFEKPTVRTALTVATRFARRIPNTHGSATIIEVYEGANAGGAHVAFLAVGAPEQPLTLGLQSLP